MSLIVEDGSSMEDADSYISVTDADAYFSTRGMTIWSNATPTEKEQALRRATDFMVGEYRTRWSGRRNSVLQSLDWPRAGVYIDDFGTSSAAQLYPNDKVPEDVRKACAELALRASQGELREDTERVIIEDTIGPLTTKWDPKSSQNKKYVAIDNLLRPYLTNGGSQFMTKLVRT